MILKPPNSTTKLYEVSHSSCLCHLEGNAVKKDLFQRGFDTPRYKKAGHSATNSPLSFRQRSAFCFDEESQRHSDREVFLLRRGIFLFSKGIDSSVAYRLLQNDTCEMSFLHRRFFIHEIQFLAKYITFVLWMQKPYKHLSNT